MSNCKGVIVRFGISSGFSEKQNKFTETRSLRVSKGLSCLACPACFKKNDAVASLPFMPDLEHGHRYQVIWCDKKGVSFKEVEE